MTQDVALPQLQPEPAGDGAPDPAAGGDLRRLSAVPVGLTVEIGRTQMTVGETLNLREGSVIALDRMADEPVDLLVNGIAVARGEVVVIDEQFGLRLTKVLDPAQAVASEVDADDGSPSPAPATPPGPEPVPPA
jgi:flagellar motor switch protein FliN